MNIFLPQHLDFLKQLLDHQVSFILVGGYAVNYHGYNRVTGDMDLWVKPDNDNKLKLLEVLTEMDFEYEDIAKLHDVDFTKPFFFHFGEVPFKIDILTRISGVSYEEADEHKIIADIEGIELPILHLNHLILSKISNNRTKDKLDVEELQKIQQLNPKK